VLDGCEAYDEAQQHAAFGLFVEAASNGVPVVAAGRLPPVDLPVREDLRTRLGWGLVFQLQPASEADARDALQREAHARGLSLPNDVLDFLLTRFARDLGSLMGWLDALDNFSLSEKRPVNLTLLRRMLAEDAPSALLHAAQPDPNTA
jgi:DnaA family protein